MEPTRKKSPYREVDSFERAPTFDEARYYEEDQFELGGVDFDNDERQGWDRPGRRSSDYGARHSRMERYRPREPYFQDYRGKGPKNYIRSDESIRESVCEILLEHSGVDATDITVEVKEGHLTLSGFVPNRRMKKLAERCLDRILGIHDVRNELAVGHRESAETPQRTNAEIDLDRFKMV